MNDIHDTSAPANGHNGHRRRVLLAVTAVLVVCIVAGALWWKFVLSVRETTDDAYVTGHQVGISAQVPGTVVAVLVENTRLVQAGEVLVQLDPADAETHLQRARGALAAAVRAARTQVAAAAQADALVEARRVELANAQAMLARREPLAAERAVSNEELVDARTVLDRARAALDQAEAQARGSHAAIDGVPVRENPQVLQARAAFREAWIAAHRNTIIAPVSGYVAQRSVQVGRRVQPGEPLMTLIPADDLWVEANFKETQLRHVRVGQTVRMTSDVYGRSALYHGTVAGIAAGTGAAFALLPPQNAAGNWIKVIQRVPVRIVLNPQELVSHPLRVGLSMEVNVDTASPAADVPPAPPADTNVYTLDASRVDAEADAIIAANLRGAS